MEVSSIFESMFSKTYSSVKLSAGKRIMGTNRVLQRVFGTSLQVLSLSKCYL